MRVNETAGAVLTKLCCAICSATVSLGAGAQILEELVITAQKREQNLSDVGVSVTAFSGGQLKELGITNTEQIDAQVPPRGVE